MAGIYTDTGGNTPITGQGTVLNPKSVSGTLLVNSTYPGVFNGSRFSGNATAKYRYTGYYTGSNNAAGVFSIDIDANNIASGKTYSFLNGGTDILNGSLNSSTSVLTLTSGDVTASATVNTTAGTVSNASWQDSVSGDYGSFTGSGCKLN